MTEHNSTPTILVADDEQEIADLYTEWLETNYRVKTAYNGQDVLDQIDQTVDVVILDRQMPKLSGDEALEEIRDQGYSCPVAMSTAVEPDIDILGLKCDDYLTKPVSHDDLRDTVENLLQRATYDERLQKYFALVSKKAVLEVQNPTDELSTTSEYHDLTEEIRSMQVELDEMAAGFDDEEYNDLFRDLQRVQTP